MKKFWQPKILKLKKMIIQRLVTSYRELNNVGTHRLRSVGRLSDGGRLRWSRVIKIELIVPVKRLIVATSVITVPVIVVIVIYKHTTHAF